MMISDILQSQRTLFKSGTTLSFSFRKKILTDLQMAIVKWLPEMQEAIWEDFHKSAEEFFLTEVSVVLEELKLHRSSLEKWSRTRCLPVDLKLFPAFAKEVKEPLGSVLIIAPWNYPFQLLINPLIGAISSGCTSVLKTSPRAPRISSVLKNMIEDTFTSDYIAVFEGHRDVNETLLKERWDAIFYTGSPATARTVMQYAARNLTPVILELGGKSPCIVRKGADIEVAARRIAWGKSVNAGQTCVAPDYLMIQKGLLYSFVSAYRKALDGFYPEGVENSPHYCRMVTSEAFERVSSYISDGTVLLGGNVNPDERYIEPTIISNVSSDSPVMQSEIFGPVLPVIEFDTMDEVKDFILKREKPLALYFFGNRSDSRILDGVVSSGGMAINDVVMHVASSKFPFGGVGNSGMGRYHGKESFLCFSHRKTVLLTPKSIEIKLRYAPYRFFRIFKHMLS